MNRRGTSAFPLGHRHDRLPVPSGERHVLRRKLRPAWWRPTARDLADIPYASEAFPDDAALSLAALRARLRVFTAAGSA